MGINDCKGLYLCLLRKSILFPGGDGDDPSAPFLEVAETGSGNRDPGAPGQFESGTRLIERIYN